jgi:hypothetical protein
MIKSPPDQVDKYSIKLPPISPIDTIDREE